MSDKAQAVIFIHGIGEQFPMDNLRLLAKAVHKELQAKDESEKDAKLRSKPDHFSDILEARVLSLSETPNRPRTDFFEYYWAHKSPSKSIMDTLSWIYKIFLTGKTDFPKRLTSAINFAKLLLLLVFTLLLVLLLLGYLDIVGVVLQKSAIYGLLFSGVAFLIRFYFVNYLGDASNYLSFKPANIEARNEIIKEGMDFYNSLVDSEMYDRVIIIGHSLGSIIGYDIITNLWEVNYTKIAKGDSEFEQERLTTLNSIIQGEKNETGKTYQELQFDTFKEYTKYLDKWLISDFISLGAPISYIDFLTIGSVPFDELITNEEIHLSPPVLDSSTGDIFFNRPYHIKGKKEIFNLITKTSSFAIIRWTNIFFKKDFIGGKAKRLFDKDFIEGKTKRLIDKGVKDVPIPNGRNWFPLNPKGHSNYWQEESPTAIKELVDALYLGKKINTKE